MLTIHRIRNVSIFFCLFALFVSPLAAEEVVLKSISIKDSFSKGVDRYLEQKYNKSVEYFRHCVNLEPDNAEYRCWLAQSMAYLLAERAKKGESKFSLIGDGKRVRDLYEKALELNPQSERARHGYGIILRDVPFLFGGNVNKARDMFESVLEENPDNTFVLHSLGLLHIRKKKEYKQGLEYLLKVIDIKKNRELTQEEKLNLANTYHAIGKTYFEHLDNPEKALDYMLKSYYQDPQSAVTLIDLVEIYQALGREAEAKSKLMEALQIVRKNQYKRFAGDVKDAARDLDMDIDLDL
ncbi:hypothetical protein GF373_04490 [bacterium]|nr:hypothetical protein [bacterium]